MNALTTEDFEQKMRESLEYQKDPEERKAAEQRQPNHRNKCTESIDEAFQPSTASNELSKAVFESRSKNQRSASKEPTQLQGMIK